MSEEVIPVLIDRRTGEIVRISRPLHQTKEVFTLPPSDTILWKYADYWKIAGLFLHGQLYFRRADKLPDIYEGRFTEANETQRSSLFADAFQDLGLGNAKPILEIQESNRAHVFLNCWHKNTEENQEMWAAYTAGPDSVVLVTNVASLFAATPSFCRGADVHYIEESEPLPEMHSLAPLVHKRRDPYAFEREFRLIVQRAHRESVDLNSEADFGRLISTDPKKLLHQVRLHPRASVEFKSKVRTNIAAAGLSIPVIDSAFADKGAR
jgi:hypothetical protein